MSLSEVPVGLEAKILSVPEDVKGNKLLSIGFVPGNKVKVVGCAPLGDPRVYMIMGKLITLRNDEAKQILVSLENDVESLMNAREGTWRVVSLIGGRRLREKLESMGIFVGSIVKVISNGIVETEKGVFKIGINMAKLILVRRDNV
ncbi:FeoA family protein [Pseudothermotoga sp.]|nr:ferrous iron transport protein A [Pseudothermotoga sp.]MDW8139228.1 FeoA family protein [Pseudothermotoga sp.]